jgi:hypothetical protein
MSARRFAVSTLLALVFAAQGAARVRASDTIPVPGTLLSGDVDPSFAMQRYTGLLLAAALGAIDADAAPDGLPNLTPLAYADHVELWPERKVRWLWSGDGIFRLPPDLESDSPLGSQLPSDSASRIAGRDRASGPLRGEASYPLRVPLPHSARLFWGVTPYDPDLRSDLQGKTLGSHFSNEVAPPDRQSPWLDTLPGSGWLFLFSVHGTGDSQESTRPTE